MISHPLYRTSHLLIKRLFIAIVLITISTNVLFAQNEVNDQSGYTIHVVQRNETLSEIADRYTLELQSIQTANRITNPNDIYVGQRLLIPLDDTKIPIPETHIVQPGESLQGIALTYGKSMDELVEINNIANIDQIYVGQNLIISPERLENTTTAELVVDPTDTPEPAITPTVEVDVTVTPEQSEEADEASRIPLAQDLSIIHSVRSGETLSQIASLYQTTVSEMATVNNIANPMTIYPGQKLIVPGLEPPQASSALPDQINMIRFNPLIFVEGETGSVVIDSDNVERIEGTFLDRKLNPIVDPETNQNIVLISVPMFTEPGIYPMNLNLISNDNQEALTIHVQILEGRYGSQNINIAADRADTLNQASESYELGLLEELTSRASTIKYWDHSLSLPAAAPMNGLFGTRRSYNGGPVDRYHSGADFAGAPGTPIFAVAPGTVVLADSLNIRGNTTVIDHGWGVYSLYAHQNEQYVQVGDFVQDGETIGTVGSTGRITGPHLHWEVWVNGVPVNPLEWTQNSFP